jgi:hypothetical protein
MFAEKLAPIKTQSKSKTDHGIITEQGGSIGEREIKTNQVLFFNFLIPNLNLLFFSHIY